MLIERKALTDHTHTLSVAVHACFGDVDIHWLIKTGRYPEIIKAVDTFLVWPLDHHRWGTIQWWLKEIFHEIKKADKQQNVPLYYTTHYSPISEQSTVSSPRAGVYYLPPGARHLLIRDEHARRISTYSEDWLTHHSHVIYGSKICPQNESSLLCAHVAYLCISSTRGPIDYGGPRTPRIMKLLSYHAIGLVSIYTCNHTVDSKVDAFPKYHHICRRPRARTHMCTYRVRKGTM